MSRRVKAIIEEFVALVIVIDCMVVRDEVERRLIDRCIGWLFERRLRGGCLIDLLND